MDKLDEAIEQSKAAAKQKYLESTLCHSNPDDGSLYNCIKAAQEHEQLSIWLEELKSFRDAQALWEHNNHSAYVQGKKDGYDEGINKAIHALNDKICAGCGYLKDNTCTYVGDNCHVSKPMHETIMPILEQLKGTYGV